MAFLLSAPLALPDTFEVVEESAYLGKYIFRPLEPGYGITIGNALRRVLLSSIEGYAIATLKIAGVLHEFSSVPGVIEDVVDIVLNLKQVALRPRVPNPPSRIFVDIAQKEVVTAGDLVEGTNSYEVANPDLVIMHLDSSAKVQMALGIAKGRGYRFAEENKAQLKDEIDLHEIVLDTSFSPVVRVVPRVETILYRDRADYEQLLLEIETKGNLTPREALIHAMDILSEHFRELIGAMRKEGGTPAPASASISDPQLRILLMPIDQAELGLTTGAYESLRSKNITRLIDLVQLKPSDLVHFRGIGKETVEKIESGLSRLGLRLGMDVSAYKSLLS